MKRTLTFTVALLAAIVGPALAEPMQNELDVRATELTKKLEGQGYTVLVEAPFVVLGDSPAKEVQRITTHAKADVLPVFSPDGTKLMWTSSRTTDGTSQLWIADWLRK